jgi:hypothetical protein
MIQGDRVKGFSRSCNLEGAIGSGRVAGPGGGIKGAISADSESLMSLG